MALVDFKLGLQASIETIKQNKSAVEGTFYVTDDTDRIYLGKADGDAKRLCCEINKDYADIDAFFDIFGAAFNEGEVSINDDGTIDWGPFDADALYVCEDGSTFTLNKVIDDSKGDDIEALITLVGSGSNESKVVHVEDLDELFEMVEVDGSGKVVSLGDLEKGTVYFLDNYYRSVMVCQGDISWAFPSNDLETFILTVGADIIYSIDNYYYFQNAASSFEDLLDKYFQFRFKNGILYIQPKTNMSTKNFYHDIIIPALIFNNNIVTVGKIWDKNDVVEEMSFQIPSEVPIFNIIEELNSQMMMSDFMDIFGHYLNPITPFIVNHEDRDKSAIERIIFQLFMPKKISGSLTNPEDVILQRKYNAMHGWQGVDIYDKWNGKGYKIISIDCASGYGNSVAYLKFEKYFDWGIENFNDDFYHDAIEAYKKAGVLFEYTNNSDNAGNSSVSVHNFDDLFVQLQQDSQGKVVGPGDLDYDTEYFLTDWNRTVKLTRNMGYAWDAELPIDDFVKTYGPYIFKAVDDGSQQNNKFVFATESSFTEFLSWYFDLTDFPFGISACEYTEDLLYDYIIPCMVLNNGKFTMSGDMDFSQGWPKYYPSMEFQITDYYLFFYQLLGDSAIPVSEFMQLFGLAFNLLTPFVIRESDLEAADVPFQILVALMFMPTYGPLFNDAPEVAAYTLLEYSFHSWQGMDINCLNGKMYKIITSTNTEEDDYKSFSFEDYSEADELGIALLDWFKEKGMIFEYGASSGSSSGGALEWGELEYVEDQ